MKKTKVIPAILLCMCFAFCGCGKKAEEEIPNQEAPEVSAGESNIYYGSLTPVSETKVIPSGKGQVESCPYKVDDYVKKGALLYKLKDSGISDSIKTTENSLRKAEISINTAAENAGNLSVYAPADGILKNFTIKTGERVNTGKIGDIVDESKLIAVVPFNESQIREIQTGCTATLLSADFMSSVPGKVSRILDEKAESLGGSILYNVEITIDNPGALSAGQSISAKIHTGSGEIVSPASGTVTSPDSASVVSRGSGNALTVNYKSGDYVKKGALILTMENSSVASSLERAKIDREDLLIKLASLKKDYNDLFVYAPASGTVISQTKQELDNITSTSESIMTIADVSTLKLYIEADEKTANSLEAGRTVDVFLNGDEENVVSGTVTTVDVSGKIAGSSRIYPITITVSNTMGIEPGTSAGVDLGGEI